MNNQPRNPKSRNTWTAEHDAAVRHLADAAQQVKEADTPISQEHLRAAVDAAREPWRRLDQDRRHARNRQRQRLSAVPEALGHRTALRRQLSVTVRVGVVEAADDREVVEDSVRRRGCVGGT